MSHTSSVSEILAGFALDTEPGNIPEDVKANAWLHLIDAFGIGVMVAHSRYADALAPWLERPGNEGPASLWGLPRTASWHTSILANGILAGAINLDDTHNESQLHPGAHLIPLALALGEREGLFGTTVIEAIAMGNEVACRLACVAPGAFAKRGMHSSSVLGKVYCALMAARLLGLDHAAAVNAAGHAASQAGGTMQCYLDGSWTLAFHHGWTAAAGLAAAELGACLPGPRESLDGKMGLFNALLAGSGVVPDYARAVSDLGGHWESRNMSFKPYATGCVIHPFIDVALALQAAHGLQPERIRRVTATIADYLVPIVCEPVALKRRPDDTFNARVSLQYVLASTLTHGRFDLDSLDQAELRDPAIQALADRIDYEVDPGPVPRRHFQGWLRIELDDGRVLEHKIAPWLRMHVGEADTPGLVQDKFLDNISRVCTRPRQILELACGLREDLRVDRFLQEVRQVMAKHPATPCRTQRL